jgi:hypothetical protein
MEDGIDALAYMQQAAVALKEGITDRKELESVLDELEFLYEALDPELQTMADPLIGQYRERLASL